MYHKNDHTYVLALLWCNICMDEKSRESAALIITLHLCIVVSSCNKHMLPKVTVHDNRVTTLCMDGIRSPAGAICLTEVLFILLNIGSSVFAITQMSSTQTEGEVICSIGWTGKHTLTGVIVSSNVGHHMRKAYMFAHIRELTAIFCIHGKANNTGYLMTSCQ